MGAPFRSLISLSACRTARWAVHWSAVGLPVCLWLALGHSASGAELGETADPHEVLAPLQLDPAKVVGHDECSKCHTEELKVWRATPHHDTFRDLHRGDEAKRIAKRMGLTSIKRGDVCWKCHYTPQQSGGSTRLVAGVSCESCHGAARDWLTLHADYGGPGATRETESDEHRLERRLASIERGMRNPANVYLIARSCLNCHTVPDERLVNQGGHAAGSPGFELVAWSQGMIRHNFVSAAGESNGPPTLDRLRLMYLAGLMADIEFGLRATALATEKAEYGVASARRVDRQRKLLRRIQRQLNDADVQRVVEIAFRISLKANNAAELNAAADEISAIAYRFAATRGGSELAAVDAWLPTAEDYIRRAAADLAESRRRAGSAP